MSNRAYVAGRFSVELDGMAAGWLYSTEGGMAQSDVISEKSGPDILVHKHIGTPKYDDITITCGSSMSKVFYDWVKDSFERHHTRKDGALVQNDFNLKEKSRLTFYQALITELGFPACDAASKEYSKLTIKFSPEFTRIESGHLLNWSWSLSLDKILPTNSGAQKMWLARNFSLDIDGLNKSCAAVNKIEALTLKQKVTDFPIGAQREVYREPASIEYPNLIVTMPEANADGFYKWYKSFIIDGKNGPENEKTGSLTYLAEDKKTRLCTVNFHHLGLAKMSVDKSEAGSEKIRCVKAEMYCEQMEFKFEQAAIAPFFSVSVGVSL